MATQGESLIKKTQKGLSILAFETTKQSRILKKRMRVAALQKETKADLRDLGNLVYNAVLSKQPGILEEEEVKILVENIRTNKAEVDRLREAIARLGRARKHFPEAEEEVGLSPGPRPDGEPPLVVEPSTKTPVSPEDAGVATERELKESAIQPVTEPKAGPAERPAGHEMPAAEKREPPVSHAPEAESGPPRGEPKQEKET